MKFCLFLIVVVLTIMCCFGCGCCKDITQDRQDSVLIEYREKVVFVPDTVFIEIPAQTAARETKDSTSTLCTDYAVSHAAIRPDGSLYHDLANIPQSRPVEVQKQIVYRDTTVYKTRTVRITETKVKEKDLHWWQTTLIWIGFLFLLFAGVKIYKKFHPIL